MFIYLLYQHDNGICNGIQIFILGSSTFPSWQIGINRSGITRNLVWQIAAKYRHNFIREYNDLEMRIKVGI